VTKGFTQIQGNFINVGNNLEINWFLDSAWEPISRGSASSIGEKKRRQSLRECVPRQSLGTSNNEQYNCVKAIDKLDN
jgi:hypothetical protein